MNAVLPVAERMLGQFGEFYPYGGYMKPDGEIVHIGAADEETDHPKSKDLLDALRDSLSKMAATGGCKAAAIVFDVRVVPPNAEDNTDAIQVCLEHVAGYSAEVFVPYKIGQDRLARYGVMFAQEGKREIFGEPRV